MQLCLLHEHVLVHVTSRVVTGRSTDLNETHDDEQQDTDFNVMELMEAGSDVESEDECEEYRYDKSTKIFSQYLVLTLLLMYTRLSFKVVVRKPSVGPFMASIARVLIMP